MKIAFFAIIFLVIVLVWLFRSIYKNRFRFVDNKGNEITDPDIIAEKKKQLGYEPIVQDRDEEMTSIAQYSD
jgi:hypothetical protein